MNRFAKILLLWLILLPAALQAAPPRHPSQMAEYAARERAIWLEDSVAAVRYAEALDRAADPTGKALRAPRHTAQVGKRSLFPRVPVIMVNFNDFAFDSLTTKARVDSMFNGRTWTGGHLCEQGSVRKYFSDQSAGQYAPDFDILGPVTLSHGYAYYGAGTMTDSHVGEMTLEACRLLNDSVDFSQYDSDADGEADLVFIYYAGYGENDNIYITRKGLVPDATNLVWPKFSHTYSTSTEFDGKRVNAFECANELDGYLSTDSTIEQAGIGVLCHEFCHGLGLPDMYTSAGVNIVGRWSLMDYGCYGANGYSPSSLTAYERYFLGWLTPVLLTDTGHYSLPPIETTNVAYMLTPSGTFPQTTRQDTIYMLEGRQPVGWDDYMSHSASMKNMAGLLVWRILPWSGSPVNSAKGSAANCIDLFRADGDAVSKNAGYGKAGDTYPALSVADSSLVDSLAFSRPDCIIRNIAFTDGNAVFDYYSPKSAVPTALPADEVPLPDVRKILRDGQLFILRDGELFDMTGRRVGP